VTQNRAVTEGAYVQKPELESWLILMRYLPNASWFQREELARPDAGLTTQTHTLDAAFNHLMQVAYRNFENFDAVERLFRLALTAEGPAHANLTSSLQINSGLALRGNPKLRC
jgi:hypothetical protein